MRKLPPKTQETQSLVEGPFRTGRQIYDQIRWDRRFDTAACWIEMQERFMGSKRVPFDGFDPEEVPWHRIERFEYNGEVVWDRAARIDRLADVVGQGSEPPAEIVALPSSMTEESLWITLARQHLKGLSLRTRRCYRFVSTLGRWMPWEGEIQPIPESPSFRVVTWNVLAGRYAAGGDQTQKRYAQAIEILSACDADLIGLQEVEPAMVRMLLRNSSVRSHYWVSEEETAQGLGEGVGQLLLMRRPFLLQDLRFSGEKHALIAQFALGGKLSFAACVHLSSDFARMGRFLRSLQLHSLCRVLAWQSAQPSASLRVLDREEILSICAQDWTLVQKRGFLFGDLNEDPRDVVWYPLMEIPEELAHLDTSRIPLLWDAVEAAGFVDTWPMLEMERPCESFDPLHNPLASALSVSGRSRRLDAVWLADPDAAVMPMQAEMFGFPSARSMGGLLGRDYASDHFGLAVSFSVPLDESPDPALLTNKATQHPSDLVGVSEKQEQIENSDGAKRGENSDGAKRGENSSDASESDEASESTQTIAVAEVSEATQTIAVAESSEATQIVAVAGVSKATQAIAVAEVFEATQTIAVAESSEATQIVAVAGVSKAAKALKAVNPLEEPLLERLAKAQPTYHSALIVIPPPDLWEPIQAIRQKHDKSYRRWMPHLNLVYGFVESVLFPDAIKAIQAALAQVKPFEVSFSQMRSFRHGKSDTIWLEPSVEPSRDLHRLQSALQALFPLCDEQSHRSRSGYTPHLSLGQLRGDARGELQKTLQGWQLSWRPVRFVVDHVALICRKGEAPFEVQERVFFGGKRTIYLGEENAPEREQAVVASQKQAPEESAVPHTNVADTSTPQATEEADIEKAEEGLRSWLQGLEAAVSEKQTRSAALLEALRGLCERVCSVEAKGALPWRVWWPVGAAAYGAQTLHSDADILCIGPSELSREVFNSSVMAGLLGWEGIEEARVIWDARVPLLKLRAAGLEVDILYARMPEAVESAGFQENLGHLSWMVQRGHSVDIERALSLEAWDIASQRSLLGLLDVLYLRAVLARYGCHAAFSDILRVIKCWAVQAEVHEQAKGYLGGMSWALLVAWLCTHPAAQKQTQRVALLEAFFATFSHCSWMHPIGITRIDKRSEEDPSTGLMPIYTPVAPQRNSARLVTPETFAQLRQAFRCGQKELEEIQQGKRSWEDWLGGMAKSPD
ncbi:RNA repair domain-containing protein [Myxococcota bacterium]|nr:RNA repair domain-containing protein [Myxococcota bacterium]